MRRVAIFALLAAAAFAAPLIAVHKEVSEVNALLGSQVAVTVTAVNVGDEPVSEVELRDGDAQKSVDTLAPGQNLTLTSTVEAANLGNLDVGFATASWAEGEGRGRAVSNQVREEERDEKKHAQELGPRGFINVVTPAEYERLNTRYIKETILFVVFAAVIAGFPFGVYRQSLMQVDFHLKESRKK
jgi:hypothetical protein